MRAVKINENNIFTVLTTGSWLLLALLTCVGLIFGSRQFAAGVLAGGVLAVANFYWLLGIMKRVLTLPAARAGRFAQLRFVVRLALMGVVIWALIVHVGVDPIGLIVGLSVLVMNIIALALYKLISKGD
jgi:ATP synthase I chain